LTLFSKIPDVAKIVYARNMIFVQRISNEASSHLDHLTINKYGKNYKGPKLVTKSGAIRGRPSTTPLNAKALPYPNVPTRQVNMYQLKPHYQPPVIPQRNTSINVTFNYNDNVRGVNMYPLKNTNVSTTSNPQQQQVSSVPKPFWKSSPPPPYSTNQNTQQSYYNNTSSSTNVDTEASGFTFFASPIPSASTSEISMASTTKCDIKFNNQKSEPVKESEFKSPAPMRVQPTASTTPNSLVLKGNRLFREALSQATKNDEKKSSNVERSMALTETNEITISSPMKNIKGTLMKLGIKREPLAPQSIIQENTAIKVSEDIVTEKFEHLQIDVTEKTTENDKENSTQIKSPAAIRARLRSMRIFREALMKANEHIEKKSIEDKSLVESETLIQLPLPIQNEEEPIFKIKVLDVLTPSKFTFQFNFQNLKELSSKLNKFYSSLSDNEIEKYRVKHLVKDNIVAVCRHCSWYRAQIKSFNNKEVQVHFVDSMKVAPETISPKYIFHLHQKFTTDSPKSVFGKLYGLKPKGSSEWSILSASKLIDIQDKTVLATVKSAVDDVYSLVIFSGETQEKRLFDMMIAADLAEVDADALSIETVNRSLVSTCCEK
jgi:hypothetical protein